MVGSLAPANPPDIPNSVECPERPVDEPGDDFRRSAPTRSSLALEDSLPRHGREWKDSQQVQRVPRCCGWGSDRDQSRSGLATARTFWIRTSDMGSQTGLSDPSGPDSHRMSPPLSTVATQRLERLERESRRIVKQRDSVRASRTASQQVGSQRRSALAQPTPTPSNGTVHPVQELREALERLERDAVRNDREARRLHKDLKDLRRQFRYAQIALSVSTCLVAVLLIVHVVEWLGSPTSPAPAETQSTIDLLNLE